METDSLRNTAFTELSQIYDVSRKTIYKWIKRYEMGGEALQDLKSALELLWVILRPFHWRS